MEDLSLDHVVGRALEKVRNQLFARGGRGLSGLSRTFRAADFNGNKKLDGEEFEEVCMEESTGEGGGACPTTGCPVVIVAAGAHGAVCVCTCTCTCTYVQ